MSHTCVYGCNSPKCWWNDVSVVIISGLRTISVQAWTKWDWLCIKLDHVSRSYLYFYWWKTWNQLQSSVRWNTVSVSSAQAAKCAFVCVTILWLEIIKAPLFQTTVELSVIWMHCCEARLVPLQISVNSKATRHHYPAVLRHMHSIYLIRFHCKVWWLTSRLMHAPTCRCVLLFRRIKLLKRVRL